MSSVNVSDAGINESEDGIELEDDIESEDGDRLRMIHRQKTACLMKMCRIQKKMNLVE